MRYPLARPFIGEEEVRAVRDVLLSGWVAQGPKCVEFEKKIEEYLGVKHAITVCNCTAGLHLALLACGIKQGDEVLVSDYTYPASGFAPMYCGAKPVFVDVLRTTYNIDPNQIPKSITKKTKAIIPVHTFGQPANMDVIMAMAEKYGLKVIEDAACAFGAKYQGKYAGTFGDVGVFSLHARKGITCFPKGTRVNIEPKKHIGKGGSSSTKFIEEIKIGDEVLTFNHRTSGKEYKKVSQTFERDYEGDLIHIVLENGNEFDTTPNHPIFVEGKWIHAEDLKVGNNLLQYHYRELGYRLIGKNQVGRARKRFLEMRRQKE